MEEGAAQPAGAGAVTAAAAAAAASPAPAADPSLGTCQLAFKWSGREFVLHLEPTDSVEGVKRQLQVSRRTARPRSPCHPRATVHACLAR